MKPSQSNYPNTLTLHEAHGCQMCILLLKNQDIKGELKANRKLQQYTGHSCPTCLQILKSIDIVFFIKLST